MNARNEASNWVPKTILLVIGALIEVAAVVAAVRTFGFAPPVLGAIGAGVAAFALVQGQVKEPGGTIAWSYVFNVLLSAGCGLFAVWALSDAGSPKATATTLGEGVRLTAPPPEFTFSGNHFDRVRGTVSGLRPGEELWLMVQALGDDRWYLMSKPCLIYKTELFHCPPVYAGTPKRTKRKVRVMVRILDSPTVRQVLDDLERVYLKQRYSLSYGAPLGRPGAAVVVVRAA